MGIVAVSNDEVVVHDRPTPEELRRRIGAAHPETKPRGIAIFTRYWKNFLDDMQVADVVAVPLSGRRVAIGVVLGDARWQGDLPSWARNNRPVEWVCADLPRDRLPEDLLKTVNSMGTICRFNAEAAANRLLKLAMSE